MYIHWFQHVPFEGLGSIESWAKTNNHHLVPSRFWAGDPLPPPEDIQMLIVMGGPMSVNDEHHFSWLGAEKLCIEKVIENGGSVLGICLGAQLLASVLGAGVYQNNDKEIGWFKVARCHPPVHPVARLFPREMVVFHWHGETFDLPAGSSLLGSSEACRNQSFIYNDCIVGLQFHLEMTTESVEAIVRNCREELVPGPWIQTASALRANKKYIGQCNRIMEQLLDYLVHRS